MEVGQSDEAHLNPHPTRAGAVAVLILLLCRLLDEDNPALGDEEPPRAGVFAVDEQLLHRLDQEDIFSVVGRNLDFDCAGKCFIVRHCCIVVGKLALVASVKSGNVF